MEVKSMCPNRNTMYMYKYIVNKKMHNTAKW